MAALALAVALAGVPAQAAGLADQGSWSWPTLAAVWAWISGDAVQMDCGSHIDPNGGCAAASTVQRDCGIMIDPNGGCAAASTVQTECDRGSHIDPNGGCSASFANVTRGPSGR